MSLVLEQMEKRKYIHAYFACSVALVALQQMPPKSQGCKKGFCWLLAQSDKEIKASLCFQKEVIYLGYLLKGQFYA